MLGVALMPRAAGQMSPGELSRVHQQLDGPLSCGKCHVFGQGRADFKCLECHTEIAARMSAKRGYHPQLVRNLQGEAECARCHAEHAGRAHNLIRWPVEKKRFDHRQAGWPLEGKHAGLSCEQCHNPAKMAAAERTALKRADPKSSMLGLSPACATCHQDRHRGQLGDNCLRCHNQSGWKEVRTFDHDATRFTLTGAHQKTPCAKCHMVKPELGPEVQYRNFVFYESCRSCHKDVHGGAFSADCKQCHSTSGWRPPLTLSSFDHSRTKYPLLGKHAGLSCRQCHKSENFSAGLPHERCLDCHQDVHGGQFVRRADGGDCGSCHSENGFRPSTFTAASHGASAYPLEGKHAKVDCARCHPPRGKATDYHVAHDSCRDCHQDAHRRQFALAPYENRCEHCHLVTGFKPASYSLAEHTKARFVLKAAHAAVACAECHRPAGDRTPFRFASTACASCHRDPHGPLKAGLACETCHMDRTWAERKAFAHESTGFELAGRHRATPCLSCHRPVGQGAVRTVPLHTARAECASCHEDPHGGQFLSSDGRPSCLRCHTASNWEPTGFDHQRTSSFSLAGAHENVPCYLCHPRAGASGERRVISYRGVPRTCEECHR